MSESSIHSPSLARRRVCECGRSDDPQMGQPELEGLFLSMRPELVRQVRRYLRDTEEAADLVHDLFLRLPRLIGRFGETSDARRYFLRMATNIAHDHERVRFGRTKILDQLGWAHPAQLESPEMQAADRERLRRVDKALTQLPARTVTIFRLSRFDGLTHREIAEALNLSVSLVEKEIIKARRVVDKIAFDS